MQPIQVKGKGFVRCFETLEALYSFEKYEEIKGLRIMQLDLKKIPENLPLTLVEFDCGNNQITKIEHLPPNLIRFVCTKNQITKIENLPHTLVEFDCNVNPIKKIENLPPNLIKFNCGFNQITKIENLPPNLIRFDCWRNKIKKIENLPHTLVEFNCRDNQIMKIENLPPLLVKFNCGSNRIMKIENLPLLLVKFNCVSNQIKKIENLPPILVEFDCDHGGWYNQNIEIEILPLSLKIFNGEEYIPKSIIDLYIDGDITEEEFLSKFPHKINVFKGISDKDFDSSCKICHSEKTTINICSYEDHCFCVDCFCKWYETHERKCLLCFKEFSL